MEELNLHEQFEIETLELMRKNKLLDKLIFGGGTMMRLCFKLPRYSVDLDFYLAAGKGYAKEFKKLNEKLGAGGFETTDLQEKHFAYLIELRSPDYPRRLKIEIRKEDENRFETMTNIAFSPSQPSLQVRLTTCTLQQMWRNKVAAFIERGAIRDAFDLEFLLRRGAGKIVDLDKDKISKMLGFLDGFKEQDYKNTLGNLLNVEDRAFYVENRFALLRSELVARL